MNFKVKPHPVFRSVRIRSTGSYVPAREAFNDEIIGDLPTSSEWVVQNLGIESRHIAAEDEFTSDLAAKAGLCAIRNGGLEVNDIDLIILATSTPDRRCPSAACLAQAKMGMTNRCPAFDIAAVCSGFLYAMTIAAQFVEAKTYEKVLVIGSDTFSKITDWNHRHCVFFGDGAGAVVVERDSSGRGFFSSLLFADGTGSDNFTVFPGHQTFSMNARAVYETATVVLPHAVRELLAMHDVPIEDVTMIVPHQPSRNVLVKTAEVLGVPPRLIKTNLKHHANTASATVPLLLDQVHGRGEIQTGDWVLFAAVGAGWTWGAALYRWDGRNDA